MAVYELLPSEYGKARMSDYERRLRNVERAIVSITALLEDEVPKDCSEALQIMAERFFYSVSEHGIKNAPFEPPSKKRIDNDG